MAPTYYHGNGNELGGEQPLSGTIPRTVGTKLYLHSLTHLFNLVSLFSQFILYEATILVSLSVPAYTRYDRRDKFWSLWSDHQLHTYASHFNAFEHLPHPPPFPVSYPFFFPITRKLGLNVLRYHHLKELATLGLE